MENCQYLCFYQEYASNIASIYFYTKQTISIFMFIPRVCMEQCQYWCLSQEYASNNVSIYIYTKIIHETMAIIMVYQDMNPTMSAFMFKPGYASNSVNIVL